MPLAQKWRGGDRARGRAASAALHLSRAARWTGRRAAAKTAQELVMILSRVVAICVLSFMAADASAQNEADQLRAIERERLRSLVDADMEVARRLHADDFQLITPLGGALSKEQYLGQIASGDIDYLEWQPEDVEVKLYGNAAVIRYQANLRIVVKGLPDAPTGRFWHTDVYEKRNGQWQVLWSQATQIQQ
jgi:hypothetical protein